MKANLATVRHRADRGWLVTVRVGTTRRSTSWPTKTAANRYAARLNSAVNAGEEFDPATGQPTGWATDGPQTVAAAAADLLAAKWPGLRATSRRALAEGCAHVVAACAPRNRAEAYRVALLALADTDLTPADRDRWRSVQQTSPPAGTIDLPRVCSIIATNLDGTPAAATTVRRRRQALAQIVGQATGTPPTLPAPARGTRSRTTSRVKPSRIGTVAEAIAVIDAVPTDGAQVAFALMLYAGLRPAEACGLRWDHVDLDAGVLTVCETLPGGGAAYTDGGTPSDVQPPKWRTDGSARLVPIITPLRQLLSVVGPGRGLVAANRRGRPHTTSGLGQLWAPARARAGAGWPADRLATPYSLRHTHASLALNAGIPIPEMAARLGHAPSMLLDTYADIITADAGRWTAVLGGALG